MKKVLSAKAQHIGNRNTSYHQVQLGCDKRHVGKANAGDSPRFWLLKN